MLNFNDCDNENDCKYLLQQALDIKKDPYKFELLGKRKTLGLLFFYSSLRTRVSTQKAAQNLGMNVITININQDGYKIETEDGVVMIEDKAEHIREMCAVMSSYCDLLAVRTFSTLESKEDDFRDKLLNYFIKYSSVPIINMESAIRHPLQGLTDVMTIEEHKKTDKPKVLLTWCPSPKRLPQATANSFAEWCNLLDYDLIVSHPKGYELDPRFVGNARIEYDQDKALEGVDFVYAKEWCSTERYGKMMCFDTNWTLTESKMSKTNDAKFMHCLPIRRNVSALDEVINSNYSIIDKQAENRVHAAQAVIKTLLEDIGKV